jgi:hypothetical protein
LNVSAERGGKFIMEVLGNYSTLGKCQAERQSLEKRLKGIFVYNSTMNGGFRFSFLGQRSDEDPVTVKELGKDFAVNLKHTPSQSGQDEKKLLNAVGQQLGVFNKNYVSYLHGSKKLEMTFEYGSIYITNAHAWVESGSTVENVEKTLIQSAPDSISHRRKENPTVTTNNIASKFIPAESKNNNLSLKDLQKSSASLGTISHVETNEHYLVEIKDGNNLEVHLKIIYDKDFRFKQYQFKPFKWLVAELKTHRPPGASSRDIDFRFTMTSARELETQEARELPIYETFGMTEILSKEDGRLKFSAECHKKVTSVELVTVDVHKVDHQGSVIFIEVERIKRFNGKNSYEVGKPSSEFSTLRLRGVFDSHDTDKAREVTKHLLSAGKIIRPLVQHK